MTIDLVLKFLKDPEREYDASEVAEGLGISEKDACRALRSLWMGGSSLGLVLRRKDPDRGRLVYRTKQAQLELANGSTISFSRGHEPFKSLVGGGLTIATGDE